jgi:hypothetical protein
MAQPETSSTFPRSGGSGSISPGGDFLTDGYITYTFRPQAAANYLTVLFKVNPSEVQIFFHGGAFLVLNQPTNWTLPPLDFNGQRAWILDYHIRPCGSVVPQQIWFPQGQGDWRNYVEQARLQLPMFFVNVDGNLGVPVGNAAAGQMNLRGAGDPAPFGDKMTTKIRIGVCALAPSMCVPVTYRSGRSGRDIRPPNNRSN